MPSAAQNAAALAAAKAAGSLVAISNPAAGAGTPPPLPPVGQMDPRLLSPLPGSYSTAVDQLRAFESNAVTQTTVAPLPALANVQANAAAASAAVAAVAGSATVISVNGTRLPDQSELNLTGTGLARGAAGSVVFTALTDGLTHGTTPWETDPSSVVMVDDFISGNETSGSIGALNWKLAGSGALYRGGSWAAPNFGSIFLNTPASANNGVSLTPFDTASNWGGSIPPAGFPLTYNTGWDSSFIFRWPKLGFGSDTANLTTKVRLYLGFAFLSNSTNVKRPAKFIGLRYDTDPGPALTLTQVAVSGSTTTYTGTITGGATPAANVFAGATFVIAGFTNAGNNVTITVTASTATTLVCTTTTQINETHAGTATGPQLVDSTYKFECFQNSADAVNVQGSVFNTGITPDNNWHRFRMRSIVQGQIRFSLDGGTETMLAMSTDTPFGSFSLEIFGNYNSNVGSTNVLANGGTWAAAPAWGTPATLAGCTSTAAVLNGTYPVGDNTIASTAVQVFLNSGVNSSASETSSTPTIAWYNAFYPLLLFGNDSESGSATSSMQIDWFSFVYNLGLATDFAQTANPTLPRFFNGQT